MVLLFIQSHELGEALHLGVCFRGVMDVASAGESRTSSCIAHGIM